VISVITYTIDFAIFGRRLRNCGTVNCYESSLDSSRLNVIYRECRCAIHIFHPSVQHIPELCAPGLGVKAVVGVLHVLGTLFDKVLFIMLTLMSLFSQLVHILFCIFMLYIVCMDIIIIKS